MIVLDATTKSLEVVLAAAVTTNQLPFVASFVDVTKIPYTPGENDGTTNGTAPVTIVSAPAASTQRDVSFVQIHNADTVAATVTVRYNNNSTTRTIIKVILAVGSQLIYTDADGWRVLDANGQLLTSSAVTVSPGGSDTNVQFNDGGSFGGDSGLTFNKTTDALTVGGVLAIGGALSGVTTATLSDELVFSANKLIRRNTSDGSDNGSLDMVGGGAFGNDRGGTISVYGNEAANPGMVIARLGNVANSAFKIVNAAGTATFFSADGNTSSVGLGTANPSTQLHTTGGVRFANFGAGTANFDANGNLSSASDERLKNIEGHFSKGLSELAVVQPIIYKWKEESGLDTEHVYVGFSAQNVQQSIPEAVGEKFALSDRAIIAALVNAVKELERRLATVETVRSV